ncbi:Ig-like domain-containing protein [Bifidobacterium sp. 82T24]|uniref:Ig-like domain-containing protein n=1 Tax=Bifidobacterium pluvialisilvae TaxID=2834436 RepID=UPI001C590244|nr:Ig-like domain-containing protein [Bifidobacterium pluvialisilvae]MBW3088895.1 Ig-like domain-containing protein [Bifidobacterium pluvialisilvae]
MGLNSLPAVDATTRRVRARGLRKKIIGVLAAVATVATMGLTAVTANAADEVGTDATANGNVYQALKYMQDLNELRASTTRRPLTLQQIADAKNADNNTTVYNVSNVASNSADGSAVPALKVNSDMMKWAQARANELAKQGSINHDDIYNGKPDWYKCNSPSFAQCTGGLNLAESSEFKGGYVFGPEALAIGYPDVAGYEDAHNPINSWYSELDYEIKNPDASASDLRQWRQGYGHYLTEVSKLADIAGFGVAKVTSGQWKGATVSVLEIGNSKTAQGATQSVEDALKEYAPKKTITAVSDATLNVVSSTTKPTAQLPATVKATYSDGTSGNVDVTWDEIPNTWNDDRKAHTVTVEGTVDGYSGKVKATLNVAAATVTKATIDGTSAETTITTLSGTNPDSQLPAQGKVVWSNGDTTDEDITWQKSTESQYGKREGGKYNLTGAIAGETVTAHVTVEAATVTTVEKLTDITVTKGTTPTNLPKTAHVTWSNGDESDENITWDAGKNPADATFDTVGDQTFTGTVANTNGKTVTLKITVVDAKITSVDNPADITVESGIDPNPQIQKTTVRATFDNGTTKDVAVTWTSEVSKDIWNNREGGATTLTGKVANYNGTVTLKVIVKPATINGATVDPATLSTPAGLDPTSKLPKTAKVTWSNNDTTDGTVKWNAIDAKDYASVGSFRATGTVTSEGKTTTVTLPITVTSAAAVRATATPESVDTIATHAPDLTGVNAKVTYTDGTTTTNTVAWNTPTAGQYAQAGSFDVTGTVQQTQVKTRAGNDLTDMNGNPLTVTVKVNVKAREITAVEPLADPAITVDSAKTAPADLKGKAKVTWNDGTIEEREIALTLPEGWNKPHTAHYATATGTTDGWNKPVEFTVSVKAATAESVADPADFSTVEGNVPALPKTADVTWSNGETTAETVTWDEPDDFDKLFDKASDTPVTVKGEVAGKTVTVNITVTAASIESVTAPKDVTIDAGQTPNLPGSVDANFSNGKDGQVSVKWKTDGVDFSNRSGKDKTVTVKGEIAGYKDGVSVNVIIHSAKATKAVVNGGDVTIETNSGTKPALPETATVTWSDNGKNSEENITWDAFDKWQNRDGDTFTVNGTAAGLPVSVSVKVNKATVLDVQHAVTVSTKPGQKPALPTTVPAKWSNGDTTNETVVWNKIPAKDYATAGQFEVKGTATVDGKVYAVTATVNVKNAEVVKVEDGVDIPTTVGKAPQLPATVKVHWGDKTTTDVTVTWNDVPAKAYAKVGSFTVKGTAIVNGKAYTITANVTVKPAAAATGTATTPQSNAQVTTNTNGTQSSKLSRTGAAIGAIVAVVVVLLAGAGLVFYMKSKRAH